MGNLANLVRMICLIPLMSTATAGAQECVQKPADNENICSGLISALEVADTPDKASFAFLAGTKCYWKQETTVFRIAKESDGPTFEPKSALTRLAFKKRSTVSFEFPRTPVEGGYNVFRISVPALTICTAQAEVKGRKRVPRHLTRHHNNRRIFR